MCLVALALVHTQLLFERFNPQRLLAHLRFRMQGALLGGRALLPLLLYHLNHTKDPFLEGRNIVRTYGQCRMLYFLIRAYLLFVLFQPVHPPLYKFPEDGIIAGTYRRSHELCPRTIRVCLLTALFQS